MLLDVGGVRGIEQDRYVGPVLGFLVLRLLFLPGLFLSAFLLFQLLGGVFVTLHL